MPRAVIYPESNAEKVRTYTRAYEFDYSSWTMQALWKKLGQASNSMPLYMTPAAQHQVVTDFLELNRKISALESEIQKIYSDPAIEDKEDYASLQLTQQNDLKAMRDQLGPIAEAVIQQQIETILADLNLTFIGQAMPPVLYHISDLPLDLIISPRDTIQLETSVSLQSDLSLDSITQLENSVEDGLSVSALVVPVGGIGSYPTMVMSSTDLAWQLEVVAHEWIHNYLTLRPLGMNYETSPEVRTMNETTANIAGKEISAILIARYYPDLSTADKAPTAQINGKTASTGDPPIFDFRKTMHATRVRVEELLAQGKTALAEDYMEYMRTIFWSNGYLIRRLNQAYFAFYGAYADIPGGAAGEDPVGPAVTQLREQSKSLKEFLKQISAMSSFEELLAKVNE